MFVGAWAGWAGGRLMITIGPEAVGRSRSRSLPAMTATIGGVGSLLYYAALLRTPSYNWLNLIGVLIASGGLFTLLSAVASHPGRRIREQLWHAPCCSHSGSS